jgi:hypothetical protein
LAVVSGELAGPGQIENVRRGVEAGQLQSDGVARGGI